MSRVIKVETLEKFTEVNDSEFTGFCEDLWDAGWQCKLISDGSKISGFRDYWRVYLKNSRSYADFNVYMSVEDGELVCHGYASDIRDEFKADEIPLKLAVQNYAHRLFTKVK